VALEKDGKDQGITWSTGEEERVDEKEGRKQILDDLQVKRIYCTFKEATLAHSLWTARFGRHCGAVVRQTTTQTTK
jgi:hypothetical protein